MTHEEVHEPTKYMQGLSAKARQRYRKVHSQESQLRKVISKYSTHYRRGKAYNNYIIRLPKQWADGLELEHHDNFVWSIISYDPVVLQLRKIEGVNANA